ncbi:hypothetical protein LP420_26410 [Massilia sp. B-10]|nr:hypothetical protein LP420_26410 [Massilia sp. B-10]UUZ52676.1 hypothetical protein LP419_25885 [Massilia sp. H-1]
MLQPPTTDSTRELAASCLLDRQSWVRQTAIAFCIADQVDVKSYYRTQLADPTLGDAQRCIVLTALAGFRDKDDVTLVRPFAQHPQHAVRQAALYAWLKLAEESKDEIALQAFSDDADSIRKIALALVRRRGAYIAFDTLQADLLARQEWTVLLEFARFGQWTLLEAVARISLAAGSSDHALTATLRRELVAWAQCSSSFTRPTPAQLHFLQEQQTQAMFDALVGGTPSFNTIVQREIALVVK